MTMNRDMDLICQILKYARDNATGRGIQAPVIPDVSEEALHYHIGLCEEAGYLKVIPRQTIGSLPRFAILNLTWDGHDFLEHTCG